MPGERWERVGAALLKPDGEFVRDAGGGGGGGGKGEFVRDSGGLIEDSAKRGEFVR